jgi:hypothetical protein
MKPTWTTFTGYLERVRDVISLARSVRWHRRHPALPGLVSYCLRFAEARLRRREWFRLCTEGWA